jgi:hypothetical protein
VSGTGEPPTTLTVKPVVAVAVMTDPASFESGDMDIEDTVKSLRNKETLAKYIGHNKAGLPEVLSGPQGQAGFTRRCACKHSES